jgi:hypothetical protein
MAQYLDKFKGLINERQTEQILKLLNKKRNAGQIRTLEEFTTQLENLMRELTSTNLIPSLTLFMAEENDVIDADRHNEMLDRVEDDLQASFEEANNIDEIQRSHEALVRDVILKNLRAGVAELESKVALYDFINRDVRGFDSAIFSTFRESQEERTARGGDQTQTLFSDPRTGELFSETENATVELIGERLTLAANNVQVHAIVKARQIFDSESPQSELVVEPPSSKLSNMVDNTKGTYWIQSLLFKERQNFVKTKIEFDLGVVREINTVEIEPVSERGLILEAIHYVDGNNIVTDLEITEQNIDAPGNVHFRKIATKRLILTFRNENFTSTQFERNLDADPVALQAIAEPPLGYNPELKLVNKELQELLGSQKVQDLIGIRDPNKESYQGYAFTIGLDNVRIGLSSYQAKSTYVSKSLEITDLGEVAIKTKETRPYIERSSGLVRFTDITYDLQASSELTDDSTLITGETSNTFFQGSIEYWVVKQNLSSDDTLIRTTVFPVRPIGVNRVFHERLVMTEKSSVSLTENDLGTLMFFTNRTDGDIQVFRNGELLADETGNGAAISGWQEDSVDNAALPDSGIRMSFRIKVLDILPGDIITVSYQPLVSSTTSVPSTIEEFGTVGGLQVVDLVGDLSVRLADGQLSIVDQQGEDGNTLKSELYLIIILRQNTAELSLSPAVEEYTLLAGTRDDTKFEEV